MTPENDEEMDELRVVKFHIPLGLHLRLHQHRLLTHRSISSTVEAALDRYLAQKFGDPVPEIDLPQRR